MRVALLALGLLAAALLGGGLGSAVTTLNSPTARSVIAEPTSPPSSSAPVVPVTVTATVGATRTATVTRTAVATQTRTLVVLTTNTVTTTPRTADSQVRAVQVAAYYANCAAVRAAGRAPIHRGEPGYSSDLDRDGDGKACE